jgi:starch phosphorylase
MRLSQEIVLGIGGVRMLKELGYHRINRYHMNEGHASLLTLQLLRDRKPDDHSPWDFDEVQRLCVFTTHTPVPAGHDKFDYDLVQQVLGEFVPLDLLKQLGGQDQLNMTHLALNLSDFVNGVAKKHGKVSREMFPGYHIDSITNGVHAPTWVSKSMRKLFDQYIPGWGSDPFALRYALSIPRKELWQAHRESKITLMNYVNSKTNIDMDPDILTIGFARRATAYKRADLVLHDTDQLVRIAQEAGPIQIIFAGKAHPQDEDGKLLIQKITYFANQLKDQLKIVYLDNYDMDLAKLLVSGVDIWLNTPRKPKEASGTSGMKAALNGIPSFSILDGWWIEGCIEHITGWAIDSATDAEGNDADNANSLYRKLSETIIPTYYSQREKWVDIMRASIGINGSFFNTHRMVRQYVLQAYL